MDTDPKPENEHRLIITSPTRERALAMLEQLRQANKHAEEALERERTAPRTWLERIADRFDFD